jgi:two-component system sensor histidine kinase UhpB
MFWSQQPLLDRTTMLRGTPRLAAYDLKWVLVRRILLATVLCVAVGAAIVLSSVASDARRQNEEASRTVGSYLRLQLVRIDSALGLPQRFPDWATVVDFSLQPGQCVKFTSNDDKVYARCVGVDKSVGTAPAWFAWAYEALFLGDVDVVQPFLHRESSKGTIEVTINRMAVAHQAWVSVSAMLRLSLALMAIMCGLVYVVVNAALKPTAQILGGLSRLAGGDLTVQLPRYRLRELDSISDGINRLARELQVATAERAEFARRLIDVQEQERRHIARELHDDVAQQLTAISGLAASIKSSIDAGDADLNPTAEDLVDASRRAIRSLRETLIYLRPPEIDELGLRASLDGLIADHNRRAEGYTRFQLTTSGQLDGFDAETSAHMYRIIQEGVTNAARHAEAKTVTVSLLNGGEVMMQDGSRADAIEVRIEDDGTGWQPAPEAPEPRFGLLGMRERVGALDGKLSIGTSTSGGASLIVRFAVPRATP